MKPGAAWPTIEAERQALPLATFQGTFHANPDYALWYGWSEMQRDLTEIKTMAEELRRRHKGEKE